MNTDPTPSDMKQTHEVTLQWDGETGDGKRAFVIAKENDGWKDLRIEVDTDDCDGEHAKAAMQVVIDCCNAHHALTERVKELEGALEELAHRIEDISQRANHGIPFYAFGDNEAACDMANRLGDIHRDAETIRALLPATPKDGKGAV